MADGNSGLQNQPNNFFSFFSFIPNFLANPFGLRKNESEKSEKKVDGEGERKSPDTVRFPLTQPEVPPLKVENEDAQDSNPFFLWQVYALGGIIVLRWAWGKWQERKANAKKDSSSETQPPAASLAPAEADDPASATAAVPAED